MLSMENARDAVPYPDVNDKFLECNTMDSPCSDSLESAGYIYQWELYYRYRTFNGRLKTL